MTIPPEALNQHIVAMGKTGSGKSYAIKGVVEGLIAAGEQVCIIDPTSAWWGLRLAADGKAKGLDIIILGGPHGDVPLSKHSGRAVASLVTQQGASVVCDTSSMTVAEYTEWFTEFATALYTDIRSPMHLVIDEAHQFAPQSRTLDPQGGRMLHAANRLMSGGRSRGIRAMLITQRPAKLHKDSLTCADTLIAMRVIAPQDREAVKAWIDGAGDAEQSKLVLGSLASLAKGEGWVWYPEGCYLKRTTFPKIRTYDSSATPTRGTKRIVEVGKIDLSAVEKAMAQAVEEAKASDPKELRKRIAELEARLKADRTDINEDHIDELEEANAELETRLEAAEQRAEQANDRCKEMYAAMMSSIADLRNAAEEAIAEVTKPETPAPRPLKPPTPERKAHAIAPKPAPREGITTAGQRVLDAIATLNAIGHERPTNIAVGLVAGIKASGGHFSNTVGPLSTGGLIVREGQTMRLTDAGRAAANAPGRPLRLSEYHARIRAMLSGASARIFDAITANGPVQITTEALGKACGMDHTGGHFSNSIGPLGTLGLIQRRSGIVTPTNNMFPERMR